MSKGPHVHDWLYNEVTFFTDNRCVRNYNVIRFCKSCLDVEQISLKNIEPKPILLERFVPIEE